MAAVDELVQQCNRTRTLLAKIRDKKVRISPALPPLPPPPKPFSDPVSAKLKRYMTGMGILARVGVGVGGWGTM